MKVIVSNYLEVLVQAFKHELFCCEGESSFPLTANSVIVPSKKLKRYLLLRLADEAGVAMGFKVLTWEQAMSLIFPLLPNREVLSLQIETALKDIQNDFLVTQLCSFQGWERAAFCDHLASLFLNYLEQPAEKLNAWSEGEGWQPQLWRRLLSGVLLSKREKIPYKHLYVFHPYLMPLYQFHGLNAVNTTYFIMSPCALYWGDLKTHREKEFFLQYRSGKEKEAWLHYLEGDHPLLGNWGKNIRRLMELFEDEEMVSLYKTPSSDTLLSVLQRELLTLQMVDKTTDLSIQIHGMSSRLQEVEMVWEWIHNSSVEPREIQVLAPDIQSYASIIEWVFELRGGNYSIDGLERRSCCLVVRAFEALLKLPKTRFSRENVEDLLLYSCFLNKFKLTVEEARQLQKWNKRQRIHYDLEGDHAFTWMAGLRRMLDTLVAVADEDDVRIDFSQGGLFNRWLEVIQLFQAKLSFIDQKWSLTEWSTLFKDLIETFFDPVDEALVKKIEGWRRYPVNGVFPFSTIERLLQSIFKTPTATHSSTTSMQTVAFSSIRQGGCVPSKFIILMGMDENAFPRGSSCSSLYAFPFRDERSERDRSLFLEILGHAREQLIITYTYLHEEDKNKRASPLVEELARYLGIVPQSHLPWVSPLPTSPPSHETVCNLSPSVSTFQKTIRVSLPTIIHTSFLRRLARHPIQFFIEERLGFSFPIFNKQGLRTEFLLSPYDLAWIRKRALNLGVDKLIEWMEAKGKIPGGPFRDLACETIRREVADYLETLNRVDLSKHDFYSIEFRTGCRKAVQVDRDLWIYPPIRLQLRNGQLLTVEGRVDSVCSRGLVYHGTDSLDTLLKVWPLYLILHRIMPSPQLILTKNGKVRDLKVKDPHRSLLRYVEYLEKALQIPSPLKPEWAHSIFTKREIREQKDDDEVIAWASARGLLSIDTLLKEWHPYLLEVFDDLL